MRRRVRALRNTQPSSMSGGIQPDIGMCTLGHTWLQRRRVGQTGWQVCIPRIDKDLPSHFLFRSCYSRHPRVWHNHPWIHPFHSNIFAGTFSYIFVLFNLDTGPCRPRSGHFDISLGMCVCLCVVLHNEPWLKSVPHNHPSEAKQQHCSEDGFLAVLCH